MEAFEKHRNRLYIIAEILAMAKNETSKTKIKYRANLSFAQLNEYLSLLLKRELLRVNANDGKTVYKITDKGVNFLEKYEEMSSLLRGEEGNPVRASSPIFWLRWKA